MWPAPHYLHIRHRPFVRVVFVPFVSISRTSWQNITSASLTTCARHLADAFRLDDPETPTPHADGLTEKQIRQVVALGPLPSKNKL